MNAEVEEGIIDILSDRYGYLCQKLLDTMEERDYTLIEFVEEFNRLWDEYTSQN